MPKEKTSAPIYVADGAGGMRQVSDLRFEAGEWPITLNVPAKDADVWIAHLGAEVEERGWNSSSLSQLEAAQNSGTLSVHTAPGPSSATLDIVWERQRGKELRLRARPSGDPAMSMDTARDFIKAVDARVQTRKTPREHRQGLLSYYGLPWRGELWLDADHRLGPPSRHPETLLGPQIVVVDAMIEGIGSQGVNANFQRRLQELRVFLGFVLGSNITLSKYEPGWVCDVDAQSRITDCSIRGIGYVETALSRGFPIAGSAAAVERRPVQRPGLGPPGITPDMHERWVPADIEQLWNSFMHLQTAKREHLLSAGNAYLVARSLWPDQRTAYATFLVVACEALKPTGRRYDRMNVYDVVASLINVSQAERLRQLAHPPQSVRSKHIHRGRLIAGELLPLMMHDYYADPSFDEMLGELSQVCRVCLIEWLLCDGVYRVIRLGRVKRSGPRAILEFLSRGLRRLRLG